MVNLLAIVLCAPKLDALLFYGLLGSLSTLKYFHGKYVLDAPPAVILGPVAFVAANRVVFKQEIVAGLAPWLVTNIHAKQHNSTFMPWVPSAPL